MHITPRAASSHVARAACGGGVFTTLAVTRGAPLLLAAHLRRLERESRLLGRAPRPRAALKDAVDALVQANRLGSAVIRLGWFFAQPHHPFAFCEPPRRSPRRVVLRLVLTDGAPRGGYTKSSHTLRWHSFREQARQSKVFDLLPVRGGFLTETGRFNVFLELDGRWWTPPDSEVFCGLARHALLSAHEHRTRKLTLAHLARATRVVLVNSVRGQVEAFSVQDPRGQEIWRCPRPAASDSVSRRLGSR